MDLIQTHEPVQLHHRSLFYAQKIITGGKSYTAFTVLMYADILNHYYFGLVLHYMG